MYKYLTIRNSKQNDKQYKVDKILLLLFHEKD